MTKQYEVMIPVKITDIHLSYSNKKWHGSAQNVKNGERIYLHESSGLSPQQALALLIGQLEKRSKG